MMNTNRWLHGFGHDVKYAIRGLARSRMFTLVCLLTLALGFGIEVTLVTIYDYLVSPPEDIQTEGLVEVVVTNRGARGEDIAGDGWSIPEYAALNRADLGMDISALARDEPTISESVVGGPNPDTRAEGDGARVEALYISPNYFRTIGVEITRGRMFAPEERAIIGDPPVIISHDTWERRLGADPEVLGRSLYLDGIRHRVIGVIPKGFGGHRIGLTEGWLPLSAHPFLRDRRGVRTDRTATWPRLLGRLHEGTRLVAADGEVGAVMRGLAEAYPDISEFRGGDVVDYSKLGDAPVGALVELGTFRTQRTIDLPRELFSTGQWTRRRGRSFIASSTTGRCRRTP